MSIPVTPQDLRTVSDSTLVLAIARYHQDALAEAYRRHGGSVFGLSKRLLRDEALAEEITQEIFLRLWQEPDRFDPARGSLRSFLLAQTHGRSVDLIRSETSRRKREDKTPHDTVTARYDIENEIIDLETSEEISDALGRLPDEQRSPIVLAYFGGYTYREVARILGDPEGTVKSRIRTGLQAMRGALVSVGVHESEVFDRE